MAAVNNIGPGTWAGGSGWAIIMTAVYKPRAATDCTVIVGKPAWQVLPCCYLVCENERMIRPEAERCGVTRRSIPASHLPLVSHQCEVAELILAALGL